MLMIKRKALVNLYGLMEGGTLDNGRTENNMARVK